MTTKPSCDNLLSLALATGARVKDLVLATAALILMSSCTQYQAPSGPEAAATFERYNGTWILDGDASDPAPERLAPLVVIGRTTTEECILSVRAGAWSHDRCETRHREISSPDSATVRTYTELASARPERLTLEFTGRSLQISDTGLTSPLTLPLNGSDQTLDHPFGDVEITAWVAWDKLIPFVELAIEDGGWVSDRYEVTPDGNLTVTRTIGHLVTPTEPLAQFIYTRADPPPS